MSSNHSKKVVLTGGPGVGKSSILRLLEKRKFSVREEVFTKLFQEAQNENRFNEAFLHSKELVHDLVHAQIDLESRPANGEYLFLDRSLIDIWGFVKNMNIVPDPQDQEAMENASYDCVFVMEPLTKEFYDQNLIRRQTYEESLEHHRAVSDRYVEFLESKGLDAAGLIERVPFIQNGALSTVQERTEFLLARLSRRFGSSGSGGSGLAK